MEKKSFLKFCADTFKVNDFERKGNTYYYNNLNGILFVFGLQKSSYGPYYYIEHGLAFTDINRHLPYPKYHELDINLGRIMPSFGKALRYEIMGDAECRDLAVTIQQKIDTIRPIVDGGKEQIIARLISSVPNEISYVLKGTAEYLEVSDEYFKKHHIPIVDN